MFSGCNAGAARRAGLRVRPRPRSSSAGVTFCESLESRRMLNAGDLDPTFNGTGKTTFPLNTNIVTIDGEDVGVQSTGKVIVAGDTSNGKLVVARFNTDGTHDTTFGSFGDGTVTTDFHDTYNLGNVSVTGVAVQPFDDKIVVVGSAPQITGVTEMIVARFTTDGLLDPTFSGDGKDTVGLFETNFGYSGATDVAIQTDGKIVIGGYFRDDTLNATSDMAVVRYNTNGTLDNTFDGNGVRLI